MIVEAIEDIILYILLLDHWKNQPQSIWSLLVNQRVHYRNCEYVCLYDTEEHTILCAASIYRVLKNTDLLFS